MRGSSHNSALVISVDSHAYNNRKWPITSGHSVFEKKKEDLKDAISSIFQECKEADWDQEGAAPIALQTWVMANALVEKLPTVKVSPSVFATRNGKIGLQWLQPSGVAMSMLVEGAGSLVYAAILGDGRKKYGSEIFNGTLPGDVREQLLQVAAKSP
jgi:hypothetical protein